MRACHAVLLGALASALSGCGAQPVTVKVPRDLAAHAADPQRYARPLGAAVANDPARKDPAYLRAFVTQFTSLTPENAMKWNMIEPSRGRFSFAAADALVDLARATRKRVRGHPLVWDQQLPGWVTRLDRNDAEPVLRTHVQALAEHFRGRVAQWDVVNEPLEQDGSLTANFFEQAMGPGYIAVALRAAHAADPA